MKDEEDNGATNKHFYAPIFCPLILTFTSVCLFRDKLRHPPQTISTSTSFTVVPSAGVSGFHRRSLFDKICRQR